MSVRLHRVAALRGRCAMALETGRGARLRGWVLAIAVLAIATVLVSAGPAWAQSVAERKPGPLSPEIKALMASDPEARREAMSRLRADPEGARALLLDALAREKLGRGWWRLVYRLGEFGAPEDVPLLVTLRNAARSGWERRIVEGTIRVLFDPPENLTEVNDSVRDFSFVQTGSPRSLEDRRAGKWVLTAWSIGNLHRKGLPIDIIHRLRTKQGVSSGKIDRLGKILAKHLGRRRWKAYGKSVMNALERIPAMAAMKGFARVRLANPLEQPMLFRISLNIWFGRFEQAPAPVWIYLAPQATESVDLPVSVAGALDAAAIRLDLRLAHFDGSPIPIYHKLYLSLQP